MNTPLPASVNSSASPSLISSNGTVYLFYKGAGGDTIIYWTRNSDLTGQGQWTDAVPLPSAVNTSDAPSAAVQGGVIYVAYKGASSDSAIYLVRSEDQAITWSMTRFESDVNTSTTPCAFFVGNVLYVFYKGAGADPRFYSTTLTSDMVWTELPSGNLH